MLVLQRTSRLLRDTVVETVKYVSGFSSLEQHSETTVHFSLQFQQVKPLLLGVSVFFAEEL